MKYSAYEKDTMEFTPNYFPKNHEKSNKASNIILIYMGYYDPKNYNNKPVGDWGKETFMPYVAHLDRNGMPDDYFFDTFLFLGMRTSTGGSLIRHYDWVKESKPGTKDDWLWFMNRLFIKDQQLEALNQAVEQANRDLGDNRKAGVFITLPFADIQCKEFGDIDGMGVSEDLTSLDSRKKVVKWYIDEVISRFEKSRFENLKLNGFYWMQEDVDTSIKGEAELVKFTASYLNRRDLRLGWIPWSGALLNNKGNELGFDFSIIQPNHYFTKGTGIERIRDTALMAKQSGQGMEIEFNQSILTSGWHMQALENYLIGGIEYGYMKESIIAYYQDVYALYDIYHSGSEVGKKVYDDIYKFSKGTYEAPVSNIDCKDKL